MADKAVFIDRDNTLTADPGYLSDPSGVQLLPGVAGALIRLAEDGYKLICITNQSGIARGMLDEETLGAIHAELSRQLGEQGAYLDAIYYCPYHPEGTVPRYTRESDERKPAPGMILRAAEELDLDLDASWMVGDRPRDIEAGQRAGCRTVRVLTGKPDEVAADEEVQAEYTTANFVEAARVILRGGAGGGRLMVPAAAPKAAATPPPAAAPDEAEPMEKAAAPGMSNNEILQELLHLARLTARSRQQADFSITKLIAGIFQGVAILAFLAGLIKFLGVDAPGKQWDDFCGALGWLAVAGVLQLSAMAFFTMGRND